MIQDTSFDPRESPYAHLQDRPSLTSYAPPVHRKSRLTKLSASIARFLTVQIAAELREPYMPPWRARLLNPRHRPVRYKHAEDARIQSRRASYVGEADQRNSRDLNIDSRFLESSITIRRKQV